MEVVDAVGLELLDRTRGEHQQGLVVFGESVRVGGGSVVAVDGIQGDQGAFVGRGRLDGRGAVGQRSVG